MNKSQLDQVPETDSKIVCDYLVVGAGTACLSFVDSLLTMRKDVTFVIVDRYSKPGGHWTKAYPFVRLHQPSCHYGVNSLALGHLDKHGREPFDIDERATAEEVCEYYDKVVKNFKATGRVRTFFESNYEGQEENVNKIISDAYHDITTKITHKITTKNGQTIKIDCSKVVQCESNVQVPSMRKSLPFETHESVNYVPLNELPKIIKSQASNNNYLVLGGGKTGSDAINYLLTVGEVHPDQVTWIVPRSMWFLIRDKLNPSRKPGKRFWKEGLKYFIIPVMVGKSAKGTFENLEATGVAQRINPDGDFPTLFKGATLETSEMKVLRRIRNIVTNKGRVTSITDKEVILENGAHTIPFSPSDTIVVDCTTDNTHGYMNFDEDFTFFNPHKIRLGPLISFLNPSHSSAQIAFLESEFIDTQSGDDLKNAFLYFSRGPEECKDGLRYLMLNWYAQLKTDFELDKCHNYREFVLQARTDRQNPYHHGGIYALLWALFGPFKMLEKTHCYVDRMENGWFAEFQTHPLGSRKGVDPSKIVANMRNPPKPKRFKKRIPGKENKKQRSKSEERMSRQGSNKSSTDCDDFETKPNGDREHRMKPKRKLFRRKKLHCQ